MATTKRTVPTKKKKPVDPDPKTTRKIRILSTIGADRARPLFAKNIANDIRKRKANEASRARQRAKEIKQHRTEPGHRDHP